MSGKVGKLFSQLFLSRSSPLFLFCHVFFKVLYSIKKTKHMFKVESLSPGSVVKFTESVLNSLWLDSGRREAV